MKRLFISIMSILFIIIPMTVLGTDETITLGWDYSNPPSDLAGFRLYSSTDSGTYDYGSSSSDLIATVTYVDGQLTYTVDETMTVPDGSDTTYYFVATAYDTAGNESGPSNEVSRLFNYQAPHVIINLQIQAQ